MKTININYLKGILRTYQELNMPNSNLSYWYQLEFSDKKGNEISFLKKFLNLPDECKIISKKINEIEFKSKLMEWFFDGLKLLDLSEIRKDSIINNFYKNLDSLIEIKEIYKIEESHQNGVFYELGIYYDYFFINNVDVVEIRSATSDHIDSAAHTA